MSKSNVVLQKTGILIITIMAAILLGIILLQIYFGAERFYFQSGVLSPLFAMVIVSCFLFALLIKRGIAVILGVIISVFMVYNYSLLLFQELHDIYDRKSTTQTLQQETETKKVLTVESMMQRSDMLLHPKDTSYSSIVLIILAKLYYIALFGGAAAFLVMNREYFSVEKKNKDQ